MKVTAVKRISLSFSLVKNIALTISSTFARYNGVQGECSHYGIEAFANCYFFRCLPLTNNKSGSMKIRFGYSETVTNEKDSKISIVNGVESAGIQDFKNPEYNY